MAFRSSHRLSVLARSRGQTELGSRSEIRTYEDLSRFGFFEDEWLREGDVRRWVPKGYADRAVYTFETGGSTGVPKSRINIEDFRLDYEAFSDTLPDEFFPKGADWLSLGPTDRGVSGWPWNIWPNIAAASALRILTRVG